MKVVFTLKRSLFFSTVILLLTAGYVGLFLNHSEARVPRESLDLFPKRIGEWESEDRIFSTRILEMLSMDEYIMRRFSNRNSVIWLYIGYYKSQKEGAVPHSPRHCYPASGWYPIMNRTVTIPIDDHVTKSIRVNLYIFSKGSERECVIYWYQSRGRAIANEYLEKIYLIRDSILRNRSDGALVRLSIQTSPGAEEQAVETLEAFASAIYSILPRFVPD